MEWGYFWSKQKGEIYMRDISRTLLEKFGSSKKEDATANYLKPSGYVYRIPKYDGTEVVVTAKI